MTKIYSLILSLLMLSQYAMADEVYGLIYNIGDSNSEGQTSLNITPDGAIPISDTLSLEYKFSLVNHRARFGYIVRLIFNDQTTINFIVNNTNPTQKRISVINDGIIVADRPIINKPDVAYNWNNIALKVVPADDLIVVEINGRRTEYRLSLPDQNNVQIIFGANNIEGFMVKDIPSVIIQEIKLTNGKKKNLWPLREHSSDVIFDEISREKAVVKSAKWECDLHSKWLLEQEFVQNEMVYPVYDGGSHIHIISAAGVCDYDIETGKKTHQKFANTISLNNLGNQFVFDHNSERIRYFDATSKSTFNSSLNPSTMMWEPQIELRSDAEYHQCNTFISPVDGNLIQLFGYGHFRYNSTMFATSANGKTNSTTINGITPRYLASTALLGDWCYVYGGVGNDSGRQELGSSTLHDLYRLNLRSGEVESLWSITEKVAEEVACRDMIIMPDNPDYGISLFYNPTLISTELTLKRINLKEPKIETLLSDPIPYKFADTESQVQLIYAKNLAKLFAIVVDRTDSGEIKLRIYSIAYPVIDVVAHTSKDDTSTTIIIVIILIVVVIGGGVLCFIRRKKQLQEEMIRAEAARKEAQNSGNNIEREITITPRIKRTGIYLLDGFTIIDRENIDITNEFAPLMKQLLSLIILYTHKNGKGVSNTILKDVLWFDKSDASARNNRSVTVSKIRQVLQRVGDYQLIFNNSYWHIEYTKGDYCDYAYAYQTIESIDDVEESARVSHLSEIAQMGELLPNQMFDFFDSFKAQYSSSVIDAMNTLLAKCTDLNNKVHLADLILRFDKVDESATREKCLALIEMGKNGVAKTTFDNFSREYATLFGEEYESSFEEFIK